MEIKTVSMIGLGALGVLYANHLSKRMPKESLRIIVDEERKARYQRDGVYCNGKACSFNYVTPETIQEPADLIIFAVKNQGLKDAITAVKNQVGEHTIIISALNGLTSEEKIGQAYGIEKLLYCVAQGTDAVKVENKLNYEHMGLLCFGEKKPDIYSEKMKILATFFDQTEFPYEAVTNMYQRQWGKFMLNVGLNQTVAVVEGNYGTVQKEGKAREMMLAAMREVMELSKAAQVDLTEADIDYWMEILATLNPEGKPSMRQDMEAKRYSEVDLFSKEVLELGKKYHMDTPVNQQLYNQICLTESMYK